MPPGRWVSLCAVAGAAGGGFLVAKGVIRATHGADVSVVPVALLLIGFGLLALAHVVSATGRAGWLVGAGWALAVACIAAGAVAVGSLLAGTIPETDDAPAVVGASYGIGAASAYFGQLALGVAAVRARALVGRLRWTPLGVVVLQFPVFIVAGAIGDGIGDETVTDGLGLLLSGLLWMASSLAVLATIRHRDG